MNMLFLMNKTKDQISWVLSHDLYWENKMYKRKRSIVKTKTSNLLRTHSAAPCESATFWPLWWRVSLSIRLYTTLNHIRFVKFIQIFAPNGFSVL